MTDRYQIISLIEKDQLGSVYMAQDTTLQRKVVFRTFEAAQSQKRPEGFSQYTGKLCALQHPNLLTIFDIAQNEEGYFMVTQSLEGESLVDRLAQGALNYVGVHNMACDLLDALHAAHSSGLFHGALRADSVKRLARVRGGHRYLIVDFGLDRISAMICGTHIIMADPVLMAPELVGYTQEPDSQSDLFTLGQLCYIALVGGHPYAGKSPEECAQAYRDGGLPHLSTYVQGVQQEFADWVMWLVAGSPDQRPASSQEAMQALHAIKLKAPSPNVPGVTQAVDVPDAPDPQKPKISEPVRVSAESSSKASPSARSSKSTKRSKAAGAPKGKRLMFAAAGTVICLLLILILILVFREDSVESSTGGNADSQPAKTMVLMQDVQRYDLLLTKSNPVNIQFDGAKTIDWTVVTGAPASSARILMKEGAYIRNILALGEFTEFVEDKKTITYRAGGVDVQPQRGVTSSARGSAKKDEGWEVVVRIPETHQGDLVVTLYMIQSGCDFSIKVRSPQKGDQVVEYAVAKELPGLVAIPFLLSDPSPGYYSIRILASTFDVAHGFEMGLSAILLEKA